MVVARTVKYYFKEDKREEGFIKVDHVINKRARNTKGFRGYISLFSYDEDNVVTVLTMWQDVESFQASEEIFTSDVDTFMPFLTRKPDVGYHRVESIIII